MKIMRPFMLYTMVKNLHPPKPGRLLGLDVGKKLIGLAVSDLQYEFAAPCGVLERSQHNPRQMAQELQKLITDLSLTAFVVGHPLKRGIPDPTARVLDCVDALDWTGMLNEVPYTLWENSFASKHAKELLYPIRLEPNDAKRFVSKFAATDVLQAFLDGGMRHEKYLNLQRGRPLVTPRPDKGKDVTSTWFHIRINIASMNKTAEIIT